MKNELYFELKKWELSLKNKKKNFTYEKRTPPKKYELNI